MLLAFPIATLILSNQITSAIIIGLIAIATDVADGYIARRLDEISEFGRFLDPVADKIFLATTVVCAGIVNIIPLWFVIAAIARDLIILLGGLYAKGRLGYLLPSNIVGKLTVVIISIVIIGMGIRIPGFYDYGAYVALGAMIISLAVYGIRVVTLIKKHDSDPGSHNDMNKNALPD